MGSIDSIATCVAEIFVCCMIGLRLETGNSLLIFRAWHRKSCSALREHWNGKAKRIAESNEAGRQRARHVQRPQDLQEDQDEEMKEEAGESQTPAGSESTGAPTLYWGGFLLELHKRLGEGTYGVVWAAKSMGHSVAVKILKSTDGLQEHSALTFRSFFWFKFSMIRMIRQLPTCIASSCEIICAPF